MHKSYVLVFENFELIYSLELVLGRSIVMTPRKYYKSLDLVSPQGGVCKLCVLVSLYATCKGHIVVRLG